MTTKKSRAFCLTINNWTEEHVEVLKSLKSEYLIIGNEIAPTTLTPHLQCYIYFKNQIQFSAMCKKVKGANVSVANGSPLQNQKYCSKENVLLETGILPVQGKRTDFDTVREALNSNPSMSNIVENATSNQSIQFAMTYLKYNEIPRPIAPIQFIWIYGGTGTGKTRYAYASYPDLFEPYAFTHWEGYDAQETVLLNDFRKDFCKFHELLRLTDIYPYRVRQLYGTRQAQFKTLIITTPNGPLETYKTQEDKNQLLRRITTIIFKMTKKELIDQKKKLKPFIFGAKRL